MGSSEAGNDDIAEVATASSAQDTDGLPIVRNIHDETSANASQSFPTRTISNSAIAGEPVNLSTTDGDFSQKKIQTDFGSIPIHDSGAHYGIDWGNIQFNQISGGALHNVVVNYDPQSRPDNRSPFDNLVLRENRFAGQHSARIKELKARHRSARLVSDLVTFSRIWADIIMRNTTEVEPSGSYHPYVSVKDRNVKAHLCHIAKSFQYIEWVCRILPGCSFAPTPVYGRSLFGACSEQNNKNASQESTPKPPGVFRQPWRSWKLLREHL